MIQFLHPWLLLGLGAVTLPLLLHLQRRREPPTVPFPAVRYLRDATREHEQRLRFRHWLLLLLRMFLLASLVLAAAGPSLPVGGVESHAPTALALIFDNSLSSGAVTGGVARLEALRRAARDIVARATPADALWLITADGLPRRGSAAWLRGVLDTITPSARRLDLGEAIAIGEGVLHEDHRPGGIVVITDLQATAVTAARVSVPVVVVAVADPLVPDLGIGAIDPGPQPWGVSGGRVTVTVAGDRPERVPVRVRVGAGPSRAALVGNGAPAIVTVPPLRPGWYEILAELDPDELRADDARSAGLRVASGAGVEWSAAGRYAAAALATLEESGRVRAGGDVTLGSFGPRNSAILPPEAGSGVGALNRALRGRGVTWQFGAEVATAASTDSGAWLGRHAVLRRYRLIPSGSGRTGVLATVAGEPWIVRSGSVILVGSRLEPEWTDLPMSADFVPFIDALVNRVARGEVATLAGSIGTPILLPDAVTEVRRGGERWRVEGGAAFTPASPGVYWLLTASDTIGALSVAADPRESALRPATPELVRRLWNARVVGATEAARAAFALVARSELRGLFLWVALVAGLAELVLASGGARRRP